MIYVADTWWVPVQSIGNVLCCLYGALLGTSASGVSVLQVQLMVVKIVSFILFYFILCRLCWFGVPAAQDSCQSGQSVWHILCRMVPKSVLSAVHSSFEHAWYPTRNKLLQVQVLYARNLPLSPPFFFKMWLGTFYQLRFCLYNEELNNGVTVGAFSPSWREQKRKMNASTEFWLTNPKERTHVEGIVVGLQWRIQLSLIK